MADRMSDLVNEFTRDVKSASTWSIVMSMLMSAPGVTAIGVPMTAGAAVTMIVGWLLLFSAVFQLALALTGGRPGAVVGEILLAVLYAFIGYYVLTHPSVGLAGLTAAITAYLFLEGILEFVLSYMLRALRGAGWLLFVGVVSLCGGGSVGSQWKSRA